AGVELDGKDAAARLGADVVVVVGLPADHGAEARQAGEAPAARGIARGERQLERAGNVERLDLVVAGLRECGTGACLQAVGEVLVEARDRDREAAAHGGAGPVVPSRSAGGISSAGSAASRPARS